MPTNNKPKYVYLFYYKGKDKTGKPDFATTASSIQQALRNISQKKPNIYTYWENGGIDFVKKRQQPAEPQPPQPPQQQKPKQLTFQELLDFQ